MLKKIAALMVMTVVCATSAASVCAQGTTEVNRQVELPYGVKVVVDLMDFGELLKSRDLYDSDDQVIAHYVEFENGYLIYDKNGSAVEYSDSSFTSFRDTPTSEKIYYLGPFQYYYKEADQYVDFSNNGAVSENEFEQCSEALSSLMESQKTDAPKVNTNVARASSTPKIDVVKLPAPKRYYEYNDTNKKCCSLAALMLLYYYADIRGTCLTNFFFDNNPLSLFNALASYIQLNGANCPDKSQPNNPYGNPTSLRLGLNAFLKTQGHSNVTLTEGKGLDPKGLAKMVIGGAKVPAIVCYYMNPNAQIGHAVLCYGYRYITLNGNEIQSDMIINDGFGNNQVYANINYAYSFQYF